MASKSLVIGFFILWCFKLNAQNSSAQELPKIIPPSPNVASLSKYGDIPVSAYSGLPNVSVPLYTITDQDLSAPISISYHASGIKVAEEASRVGLGWALNAGGVISRTIVGNDDFLSGTFGYHVTSSTANVPNGPRGHLGSAFNIQSENNINVGGIVNLPNLMRDGYDFQPDVYNFNFLGSSGKFYLKRDLTAVLEKKEKLSIRCVDAAGSSWEITTADGNKFLFEEYETYTDNLSGGGQPITAKTAWYLTKIISPKGATITFQYNVTANYIRPTGSFYESTNPVVLPTYTPSQCARVGDPYPNVATVSPGKDYRNVYLNKITFKNGEVKFNYSGDRLDLSNDVKLTDIQVFSKNLKDGSLKQVKKWIFNYSYFVGTGGPSFADGTTDLASKRLKLDGLFEVDGAGSSLPPYRFNYFNSDPSQSNLHPSKVSYSRDHWGYYNGKGNSSFIPNYSINNSSDIAAHYIGIQGTNRDVGPQFAQLFALNEIQYPTGGKTVLEYESNDFDISNSKVNDHSYFANIPEIQTVTINKLYFSTNPGAIAPGNYPVASDLPNKLLDISDAYMADGATTTRVSLTAFFRFTSNQELCASAVLQGAYIFTLTSEDGLSTYGTSDLANTLGGDQPFSTCSQFGVTFKNDYDLPPGKYYWKLNVTASDVIKDVSLRLDYNVPKATQPITNSGDVVHDADFAGGLRIKRIYDFDGTGNSNFKHYLYHFTDTTGKIRSYGRRMSRPIYTYFDDSWRNYQCEPLGTGGNIDYRSQHLIRESDSNVPLNGSAGGSVVGYDKVIVLNGENGENGKSELEYENVSDVIWDYSEIDQVNNSFTKIPRKPPTLGSFSNLSNGNLRYQTDFAKSGESFVKVKEIVNTYFEVIPANNAVWYGIERRNINVGQNVISANIFRGYVYPTIVETRKQLASTTTIVYDQFNGAKSSVQTINYTYDNSSHLQLVSSSETLSNGDVRTTEFTYPLSYSDQDADNAIIKMKELFMHSLPITKKTILVKNGESTDLIAGGEINKYQLINNKVFPKEIAALETIQPISISSVQPYIPSSGNYPSQFQPKIFFDEYDMDGNLSQLKKPDDISKSYLYDYGNRFPIAEVTNAKKSEIAFSSFESDGTGNWNINSTLRNSTAAITGSKSYDLSSGDISKSNLVVDKEYILAWWAKNRGVIALSGLQLVTRKIGATVNGWTYEEQLLKATSTTGQIFGNALIDEARFYPNGARMSTYTFEPLIGLSSTADANGEITYFEYDGFNRLKNIKDYLGNIVKNFQYNYRNSCGTNCFSYPMKTFSGSNTLGYPVGVFDVEGKLIDTAVDQPDFIEKWNSNTANQQVGTLFAGSGNLNFNLTLNSGQQAPSTIIGCRYYQIDIAHNEVDGIRNANGAYVDFGDGTTMKLGTHSRDVNVVLAPNTTMNFFPPNPWNPTDVPYFIHTYPSNSLKTITIYHNDGSERPSLDNLRNPATSLTTLRNVRGNFPQFMTSVGGSCYQYASISSVANVSNWNSINSVIAFNLNTGDSYNLWLNVNYSQDFMQNNKGLQSIFTTYGTYLPCYSDPSFKISRLKSDWNTYFTNLKSIQINDDHWNREDLSALTQLNSVFISAGTVEHGYGGTPVPIPSSVIDNIINQISAGAGQYVQNGVLRILPEGNDRTSASDASVNQLKSKGWSVYVGTTLQ